MDGSKSSSLLLPAGAVLLALLAPGCSGGGTAPTDGGVPCRTDLDCDDGFECTIDSCGVSGVCRFDEIDERCPEGQLCEAGRGCVSSATCSSDADCEDAFPCTIDSCGVGGICNHRPVDERCEAGETCSATEGCVAPTGCGADAECDDGVPCTRDSCTVDRQCRNLALDELCDQAAGQVCNQTRGCFVPQPCTTAADCDDGNFCNGAEVCVPEFGCEPAPSPRTCDDSEDCTVDSCDPVQDMCVFACDPSRGTRCMDLCPPPPVGCVGRFRLAGPTTVFGCSLELEGLVIPVVTADFSEVTFALEPGRLNISPRSYMTMPASTLVLEDEAAPTCPSFNASAENSGTCTERYRFVGTFLDDDNITGMFEVSFVGDGCAGVVCTSGSFAVTGTRL